MYNIAADGAHKASPHLGTNKHIPLTYDVHGVLDTGRLEGRSIRGDFATVHPRSVQLQVGQGDLGRVAFAFLQQRANPAV